TGQFRPENALLANSPVAIDRGTLGPSIDQYWRSSDPAYFAAGNLLRGIETAGQCWREGRAAARADRHPGAGARRAEIHLSATRRAGRCARRQSALQGARRKSRIRNLDRPRRGQDCLVAPHQRPARAPHRLAGRRLCAARRPPDHRRPGGSMSAVIAVDQGTTGSGVHVLHADGTFQSGATIDHKQFYPQSSWVEHDAEELVTNVAALIAAAKKEHGAALKGIGIANQGETIVAWDARTKRPIHRAIVWQDARTHQRIEELKAAGHEATTLARAGLPLDP